MGTIKSISAREIYDSRGLPTVQVELTVQLPNGDRTVCAATPSGASTGTHEALELRDNDSTRFSGKGVRQAVSNIEKKIAPLLIGLSVTNQMQIDRIMLEADGTFNKSHLGANAILPVSLAVARAGALASNLPLYKYIGGTFAHLLPSPMMNIINGGAHADNDLDFQEFMIRPIGAPTIAEALRWGAEIFHTLKVLLRSEGHVTAVGDEGGFAPRLESNEQALDLIIKAIEKAGYTPQKQITIALDCAATEFFDENERHYVEKKKKRAHKPFAVRSSKEQIAYLENLCSNYPIIDSIEDGLSEDDWESWAELTHKLGKKIQIVGDDLFVTNLTFLKRGIQEKSANAILIKPNQIGTLTETLATIHEAQTNGLSTIISHRSGETEDDFIADLAVAVNSGQIKTGSLSRSDRMSKYNRLIAIDSELGSSAKYG